MWEEVKVYYLNKCSRCGGYLVVITTEGSSSSFSAGLYQKCELCGAEFRIW